MVSGTAWGLGGLVPHILFDLHNTVPARPSIPFPSLYLGNEWGRGGGGAVVQEDRAGGGNPEDPWLVGKGLA